jgi:hypothetical protein
MQSGRREDHAAQLAEVPRLAWTALRRVRVRAVLGRRRGVRPVTEPAHGHATAGQNTRGRRQDAARRQQPRDEGILSGAVDVRSDLLRRLRASSPPHTGHRGSSSWRGRPTCSPPTDYTYRERHGEAIYRFKGLPSRRRGTACSRATSSAATSCLAFRRTPSTFACATSSASTT